MDETRKRLDILNKRHTELVFKKYSTSLTEEEEEELVEIRREEDSLVLSIMDTTPLERAVDAMERRAERIHDVLSQLDPSNHSPEGE